MLRHLALTALLLAGSAFSANTIVPSNDTLPAGSTTVNLTIATGVGMAYSAWTTVLPLNPGALSVQNSPRAGGAFLSVTSNYLRATSSNVVFISCDTPTTNIDPWTIYNQVQGVSPIAIVLYTTEGNRCMPQPNNSVTYQYSYTMMNASDSLQLLSNISNTALGWNAAVGGNPNNASTTTDPVSGPAPGTALAMIILYAITGTITALFILIIITGTVRAHRHPERYGPRTVDGQPKRTRAGGLARAMLDTIPVVKFGDRTTNRPSDIELAETTAGATAGTPGQPETREAAVSATNTEADREDGIAAASSSVQQSADTQGCSICTEDFEIGQDQRVLPCEHCFHPACIDPWLLNVSGTCPLCRIDLHAPIEPEKTAESEPIRPTAARRRSVLMAITGLRRPDGMSREERLQALRRYRLRQQREDPQAESGAAPSSEAEATPASSEPQSIEEEGRTRRRLRQLFNVRTRRTTTQP